MTPLAGALSAALLHFVWQGMAVAVPCWIALFLLRRRSAASRYVVAGVTLALLAALPLVTTWLLYQPRPAVERGVSFVGEATVFTFDAAPASFDWLAMAQEWAVPVWACGVVFFALRMTWGCAQVARLRRRGTPAGDGLLEALGRVAEKLRVTRAVRMLVSTAAQSPSVVGWLRPVILLPMSALAGLPMEQLEAVLAHELAHIRRHDYLVNLLQMAVESLLFYHPAVWWVSGRMRHERELCCDDVAASASGGPLVYARALTAIEKMRGAMPAVAMGATGGRLVDRIRRLAGGEVGQAPSKPSGLLALAVTIGCIVAGVNWAQAQQAPPAPPAAPVPSIPSPAVPPAAPATVKPRPVVGPAQASLPAPQPLTVEVVDLVRFAAEQQLTSEQNQLKAARSVLRWERDRAESRLRELTGQADADPSRIEQATKDVQAIQRSLDLAIRAEGLAEARAVQLAGFTTTLANLHRYIANAEMARTVQLISDGFGTTMERTVDATGRIVERVEFRDVPQETVSRLTGVLPVKAGDKYTLGVFNKIARAIHELDPQLRFYFAPEGQFLVLRIEPAR